MSETVPLRRIAQINPSTPEFDALDPAHEITFMPLEAVWSDQRLDTSRKVAKAAVESGYTRFRSGDAIVPKVSPTFTAARTAVINIDGIGAGTTELHVLRATEQSDIRFLSYVARSKHFLEEGETAYEGVAGLRRVPADFLAEFRVPALDTPEQRRIADFLDDQVARIDSLIAARLEQSRLLEQRMDSLLSSLLNAGSRVPMRRLIHEAVVGIVVKPAALYVEMGGVPALRGLDVKERRVARDGHVEISTEGHAQNPRSALRAGDVVVVRTGDAGSAAVVPPWAYGWNCIDLVVVRPAASVRPQFVELVLNASKRSGAIGNAATGALHQHFGVNSLRGLLVPDLTPEEQDRAVTHADVLWSETVKLQASIDRSVRLLNEYKQSLITAAVSGEFDIAAASGSRLPVTA